MLFRLILKGKKGLTFLKTRKNKIKIIKGRNYNSRNLYGSINLSRIKAIKYFKYTKILLWTLSGNSTKKWTPTKQKILEKPLGRGELWKHFIHLSIDVKLK